MKNCVKLIKYWLIPLMMLSVLALAPACSRKKGEPQLNEVKRLQAEQQKRTAEQRKAQAKIQTEQKAWARNGVGWLMARHGQVTVRGILVRDAERLKDEFSSFVKAYLQHGRDFDGEVVTDTPDSRRKIYTPAPGQEVQAILSRPVRPGSTLVVDLAACLADVQVDQTCVSPEEAKGADARSLALMSLVCQLNRDFGLRINPMLIRRATAAPAQGQSAGGMRLRGQGISGNGVENVILCGTVQMADLSMVSAVARNVILKNFSYEMNGNYGYGLFEIGADKLFVLGANRLESKAREGGQVDPPAIHLEVLSRVVPQPSATLDIISVGADISSATDAKSDSAQE